MLLAKSVPSKKMGTMVKSESARTSCTAGLHQITMEHSPCTAKGWVAEEVEQLSIVYMRMCVHKRDLHAAS